MQRLWLRPPSSLVLDFDENHLDDLDDDEDGTEEEGQESEPFVLTPEGAQACICKHCDVRVFVSINARDLCKVLGRGRKHFR